jgi:dimethylhistidine N-methyltransferase
MIETTTEFESAADSSRALFAREVRRGLGRAPKELSSKFFYDALGSQLFEAICELPWYEITRAERRLLDRFGKEIGDELGNLSTVIELGCGSGQKLALLIERMRPTRPLACNLIDVSRSALTASRERLRKIDHVFVVAHQAPYSTGLRQATAERLAGSTLIAFLGSNIGNFHYHGAIDQMRQIRAAMRPGDGFLLGADLVKPERELLLAYGDPVGVTAAFNKNLLSRINRELGGDFDLAAFVHRPRWNAEASRVESYLVSQKAQHVEISGARLGVDFAEGEPIWTESSYKYSPDTLAEMGKLAGLSCRRQWIDRSAQFALTLFEVR